MGRPMDSCSVIIGTVEKAQGSGDIAITNSEIATVEQWAKNLDSMTIKQYQTTDAKEQEKIENAFSNSVLAKRATAIIGRRHSQDA